tara:strand:- start:744 stop:956 length:213 start_codon:yes stop_codon:yes gene_type:complete
MYQLIEVPVSGYCVCHEPDTMESVIESMMQYASVYDWKGVSSIDIAATLTSGHPWLKSFGQYVVIIRVVS